MRKPLKTIAKWTSVFLALSVVLFTFLMLFLAGYDTLLIASALLLVFSYIAGEIIKNAYNAYTEKKRIRLNQKYKELRHTPRIRNIKLYDIKPGNHLEKDDLTSRPVIKTAEHQKETSL